MSKARIKPKVKILKNGPYLVSGRVLLSEKIITPKGKGYELKEGRLFEDSDTYSLCRCGKSKNKPFCDGAHRKIGFDGTETASRESYAERAEICEGPQIDIMDDHRCALARFCHREDGLAWELVKKSDDPRLKDEAIKAATECPSGRLVATEKTGAAIEPEYEPSIEILQDPEKGVSGPVSLKGYVEIESSGGLAYETRNRVALCRCGSSRNKPFCDSSHVETKFSDK